MVRKKVILIEVPIGRTSATLTVLTKKEYFILHDKGMWIFCVIYSSNKKCFYFFLNKGLNLIEITLKQYKSVPACFMNVKASKI